MFIVSRYRAPWVAFAFIAVVAIGAYMRWEQSSETEAEKLKEDRTQFVEFKKDLAPVGLPEKTLNSHVLFEVFRCGVLSIDERTYCNKVGEDFFSSLSEEQKEKIRPILQKYFANRTPR